MQVLIDNADILLRAFGLTLLLVVVVSILSLLFGTVLAAMRVGPIGVLNKAGALYVTIFRNNPLLVLLLLVVFGLPKLGVQMSYFNMNVLALTLYTSPFVCEALRAGVNSIPIGQAEAARSLGLTFGQSMTAVVLPQSFRAVVPPLASVLIAMVKNTSLVSIFGLLDATARMKGLLNDHPSQLWWIFGGIALGYVIIVEAISLGATLLERRWRVA
ncbi:amino acid ABC transporter permease [Aeromicrobium ginsengisoli]|uniref:Amino acid ABC transporter permease n=1 Tax=Aeromicrobium ginsengisoli TaxID=363867 RepID=A0A5M4FFY4_9ACTN|nr:amino acid ABC transporter permease [Aeromicrobium ginsengisoli]KAA1398148.1 amino acid ABC transporter permease [Aeromicrobium ginsengisoli]